MRDRNPDDIDLLAAGVPVGILSTADEFMRLVEIKRGVVDALVGAAAESVTTGNGYVFWFSAAAVGLDVNRTATLNLYAVSRYSVRTVPFLRGDVLITGLADDGGPARLTIPQIRQMGSDPEPRWWSNWVLHVRYETDKQRRRRHRP